MRNFVHTNNVFRAQSRFCIDLTLFLQMRTSNALTQTAGDRASHPTTVQIDNVISSDDDCVITGESAAVVAEKSLHTSYY